VRRRVGKPGASAKASDPSAKDESPALKNPKEREPSRQLRVAASISPTVACHSASAPEREQGESECGNTLPRGEHEQLVSRGGFCLLLGRWETFWRTSGSAKAATMKPGHQPLSSTEKVDLAQGTFLGRPSANSEEGFAVGTRRRAGGSETLELRRQVLILQRRTRVRR
jgi:hypothetical protein